MEHTWRIANDDLRSVVFLLLLVKKTVLHMLFTSDSSSYSRRSSTPGVWGKAETFGVGHMIVIVLQNENEYWRETKHLQFCHAARWGVRYGWERGMQDLGPYNRIFIHTSRAYEEDAVLKIPVSEYELDTNTDTNSVRVAAIRRADNIKRFVLTFSRWVRAVRSSFRLTDSIK